MAAFTTLTQIRADKADVKRLDKLAAKLEKARGGSWARPYTFKAAVDALEEKLSQPAEVAHA